MIDRVSVSLILVLLHSMDILDVAIGFDLLIGLAVQMVSLIQRQQLGLVIRRQLQSSHRGVTSLEVELTISTLLSQVAD